MKWLVVPIVLVIVLGVGYMMWSQPKDLDVEYTQEDIDRVYEKAGVTYQVIEANDLQKSVVFSGRIPVDASFSSEELTARANTKQWKYDPLSDTQVKITGDTVEVSSMVKMKNINKLAERFNENLPTDKIDWIPVTAPLYAKGTVEIKNNNIIYDIEELEIGKVSIQPSEIPQRAITETVQRIFGKVEGLQVDELRIENDELIYKGSMPAMINYQSK